MTIRRHTIDACAAVPLRFEPLDSGGLFDEALEADESQRQTEAAQDYWRQQCYPLSGEVLEAALNVWPDVHGLVKDMQALLRETVPAAAGAGLAGRLHCADASSADPDVARFSRWLGGQGRAPAALGGGRDGWPRCAVDKRKLQARYYTDWFARITAWTQDPLNQPLELKDSAPGKRLCPEGMAEAFKGSTMDLLLPTEFAELAQLLHALDALPATSVALRLHAAVHAAAPAVAQAPGRYLWLATCCSGWMPRCG